MIDITAAAAAAGGEMRSVICVDDNYGMVITPSPRMPM